AGQGHEVGAPHVARCALQTHDEPPGRRATCRLGRDIILTTRPDAAESPSRSFVLAIGTCMAHRLITLRPLIRTSCVVQSPCHGEAKWRCEACGSKRRSRVAHGTLE